MFDRVGDNPDQDPTWVPNPKADPDPTWGPEPQGRDESEGASSIHDMPTSAAGPPTLDPFMTFGGVFEGFHRGGSVPGYTIKHILGEGGMGAVYLAEQQRPRRTVALKMIRPDRVTKATLRRFDYEAQLLASLRHPGIAAIYEVGSFELGGAQVPYFAMEYIEGARTLTAYASANNLGTPERLELFLKICDAVQHGHQQGVIHRDLKPANILVDSAGAPRIIDFGVAKGADSAQALATMQTDAGQIVGTLQYMAPEQCGGAGPPDIRSDVYALGAVLYELLAGRLAYDVRTLSLSEAILVITQIPPPALSTVSAALRGDLSVIVAKALEKDRKDRYQSVSEFAGDIRRFLNDEPILARPVGPLGLLRKWVKRNRELSVALGTAAALLLGVSSMLIGRIVAAERQARENLALAEVNLAASRESVDLVREMLNFSAPDGESRIREGMVDVEVLLDDAATSITEKPPALPGTEAAFRELLGVGYISLRSNDKAKAQLERVLALRRTHSSSTSAELAEALHGLARAHYWAGEFDKALPLYVESLEIRRKIHAGDHDEIAMSLTHLAATEQRLGRLEEAERGITEALRMRQRLHGAEHEDIAASLNNLGNLLLTMGDLEAAEWRLRESLEMILRIKPPGAIEISNASHNLARVVLRRGRLDEAKELYRRALEIRGARLKPDDERIWASRVGLAEAMLRGLDDGDTPGWRASVMTRLRGSDELKSEALGELGDRLARAGAWADAVEMLDESIAVLRRGAPMSAAALGSRLVLRAECATAMGDFDLAESALSEARSAEPRGEARERYTLAVTTLASRLRELGRDTDADRAERLALR